MRVITDCGAHPDAQKGGTAKKKFGDNCVSSQIGAAHPDVLKGGTTDKVLNLYKPKCRSHFSEALH